MRLRAKTSFYTPLSWSSKGGREAISSKDDTWRAQAPASPVWNLRLNRSLPATKINASIFFFRDTSVPARFHTRNPRNFLSSFKTKLQRSIQRREPGIFSPMQWLTTQRRDNSETTCNSKRCDNNKTAREDSAETPDFLTTWAQKNDSGAGWKFRGSKDSKWLQTSEHKIDSSTSALPFPANRAPTRDLLLFYRFWDSPSRFILASSLWNQGVFSQIRLFPPRAAEYK